MTTLFKSGAAHGTATKVVLSCFKGTPAALGSHRPLAKLPTPHKGPGEPLTTESMVNSLRQRSNSAGTASKFVLTCPQVRFSHTDVVVPNMDACRLESTKRPDVSSAGTIDKRRNFEYAMIYGVAGTVHMYLAKQTLRGLVEYKSMPSDMLAMASAELNIGEIPVGGNKTFEWRGKPVFVKHRTKADIEAVRSVALDTLRDPAHDETRIQKDDWLVVMGICTHLGCVPIAGAGSFGGYYCPCHGSHYDASGRIRKGPAPLNLEVPAYHFKDDTTVIVGVAPPA